MRDFLPSLFGLIGVVVGGILQWALVSATAREQRRNQLVDEERIEGRERQLASFALAEHLEDFVLSCIEVVSTAGPTNWETPFEVSPQGAQPIWLEAIPPWPDLVDWRLIGFSLAVESSNLRRRVLWDLDVARGISDFCDTEASHWASAEAAAKRGIEAWALAVRVRELSGLDRLEWPDDTDGPEVFSAFVERAEKFRAEALKSMKEMAAQRDAGA